MRGRLTALMLGITAAALLLMALNRGDDTGVEARIVLVERGDVAQIAALSGRIAYLDETLVYAAAPGIVSEVLAREGERVAKGQALIRLETAAYDRAVSAWLAAGEKLENDAAQDAAILLEGTVIRAPENATVRQIMTARSATVTSGMPVMLLSSTQSAIVCSAAEADVQQLRSGMKAELSIEGESVGTAEVSRIGEITADALTGRMVCSVTLLPDSPLELPAGAAVDVDVIVAGKENATILPVEAVTERGTVWWVSDGRCTEIPVKIVLSDEMNAWVDLPEGIAVAIGEFEEGQRIREVEP